MIRPTEPEDIPRLLAITEATGVFKPGELDALREVLADHFQAGEPGHRAETYLHEGIPVGFSYYAPSAMSEGGWYLWWIVVEKDRHGLGIGSALLSRSEAVVKADGGRLLLIETSSQASYEPTRQFYLRRGYTVTGVLPDFYADGDDMVVFAKRFRPRRPL